MADNLVIVESPAKAKTIKKYLGKDFEVLASYGHVRDLVPKEGAVDPDDGFAHEVPGAREERDARRGDRARAEEGQGAVPGDRPGPRGRGDRLAPEGDPQGARRPQGQGRAPRGVLRDHQATPSARRSAQPRELSLELVNAQQARRALDYLVGFNLSPLLWKKVRRGLSAGRVQSPALRMICEREDGDRSLQARRNTGPSRPRAQHSDAALPAEAARVSRAARSSSSASPTRRRRARSSAPSRRAAGGARRGGQLRVLAIDRKQRRRNPAPPFTTSTLQQEAARKLGFNAQRTMRLAQQLYEGVDIGEGSVGLITYMRTDSVSLAAEAVTEIREVDRAALRQGRGRRRAAHLQDQVEERAGSARGHPPDLGGDHAGGRRGQDRG